VGAALLSVLLFPAAALALRPWTDPGDGPVQETGGPDRSPLVTADPGA